MILYTTETIYHFTCQECSNWWSYASNEKYIETKPAMSCPHCGKLQKLEDNNLPDYLERQRNEI